MAIIALQAKSPIINDEMKPVVRGNKLMEPEKFFPLIRSRATLPRIGSITIKNEKRAASSRLLFNRSAVDIVAPSAIDLVLQQLPGLHQL